MDITYTIPAYNGEDEVISLADAKLQLNIEHDYEDGKIQGFIDDAIAEVESYINGPILERSVVFGLSNWMRKVEFPTGPVTAVSSVEYYADGAGDYATLGTTAYKLYNFGKTRSQLLIKEVAENNTLEDENMEAVKITAVVGWAADEIPGDIIKAVKLILTDAYEFRGDKDFKISTSSRNLLRTYRQF